MNACTRHSVDFTFRYGGDEFAVILSQANHEQVIKIMNRVLVAYRRADFTGTSVSIGLVRCCCDENLSHEGNMIAMVELADKTLYQAKSNGKNSIVVNEGVTST